MLDKANSAIRKLNSLGYTYDGVKWAAPQAPSGQQAEPTQEQLDAFILRAGFRWGWENVESAARMMARQAVTELNALAGQQSERPAPAKSKCALCDEPARIAPVCDACHDSMGTKPKAVPAGQADTEAPFGRDSEDAPDWMRKKAGEIAELFAAKGRGKSLRADIIEAMQGAAIAALAASQAERPAMKEDGNGL